MSVNFLSLKLYLQWERHVGGGHGAPLQKLLKLLWPLLRQSGCLFVFLFVFLFVCLLLLSLILLSKGPNLGRLWAGLGGGTSEDCDIGSFTPALLNVDTKKKIFIGFLLYWKKCIKADDMEKYLFSVHGHCAERDCDNKWGSFDQLEKQSENAIVLRIIKERKQKLEKEKNNDDTNEYRHKERGGLRAINILADCPLTPTARNITHIIYWRQLKCSRN